VLLSFIKKIIVEGDSLTIIKALQNEGEQGARYGHILDDTKLLLGSFMDWKANHVSRIFNIATYKSAKMASKDVIDLQWREAIPYCIFDIVGVESSAST
jgi:hypothetical protein